MMQVLFLNGIPGSGKSSIAEGLSSEEKGIYHLSLGNHLRAIANNIVHSSYTAEVVTSQADLAKAKPLKHNLIQSIIMEYIDDVASKANLIIIEPYPRSVSQVKPLLKELKSRRITIVGLAIITVDKGVAVDRAVSRGDRPGEIPATREYAQERVDAHTSEIAELNEVMGQYMPIFTVASAPTIDLTVERAKDTIPYLFTR